MIGNPFIGLVAPPTFRPPVTKSFSRVIDGKRVAGSEYVPPEQPKQQPLCEDEAEQQRAAKAAAKRERELAYYRARHQRMKDDPEYKAKRKAWYEANKQKVIDTHNEWRKQNPERLAEIQQAYRLRHLEEVRKSQAEAQRRYYWANRDAILARNRANRAAKREQQQ
jgi:hypothetical protein